MCAGTAELASHLCSPAKQASDVLVADGLAGFVRFLQPQGHAGV